MFMLAGDSVGTTYAVCVATCVSEDVLYYSPVILASTLFCDVSCVINKSQKKSYSI
jgi:hypothetical protein